MSGYSIRLSRSAHHALLGIRSYGDAQKVARRLKALEAFPFLGAAYDPLYESKKPPVELLATFAGHYGIYYTVDEVSTKVDVLYLEDERRDPMHRFEE